MATSKSEALLAGFADPVFDAQAVFRAALEALSYPGRVVQISRELAAPSPLDPASGALALALLDFETPLWLDEAARTGAAPGWLGFHTGAPTVAAPEEARFALAALGEALPPLDAFAQGDAEYPDRSATLILQVPSFDRGLRRIWRGPGIREIVPVGVDGLPARFWAERELSHEIYPAGVDVFFTCGMALLGLPRTIRVEG